MAPEATAATERTSRSVTIPAKLYDRVSAEAERRDVSVTFLVSRALDRVLPSWEGTDLNRIFDAAPEA